MKPTSEQLIDMKQTLNNTKISNHQTMANPPEHYCNANILPLLPTTVSHMPSSLICKWTFQSTHQWYQTVYRIHHSFSCKSSNLFYLHACNIML